MTAAATRKKDALLAISQSGADKNKGCYKSIENKQREEF